MISNEKDAINLIDLIEKYILKINSPAYTLVITTCTQKRWIELGKHIHVFLEQNNRMNIILKNCLINMYGKCGYLEEAVKIFNNIEVSERNIITWTTMILTYGEHGKGREALMLYEEMQKKE
jgi:pentatricopeptide repeat protein